MEAGAVVCHHLSMTSTATPRPEPPPPRQARRGLVRSRDERVVAGVAGGLGRRFGVDPMLVRIGFVVLTFAGGFGLLLYGLLWIASPLRTNDEPATIRPVSTQQGVALALITLGLLLLLRGIGLWFGDAVVVPVVLAAAGSAVVWSRGDEDDRARWAAATPRMSPAALREAAGAPVSPVRVVAGTVLVAIAAAGFLTAHDAWSAVRDLGLAVIAAVAGAALLFGPWLYRLVQQLGAERRERIRQEERAELAAHLHDSVLQTLALIQRAADDSGRVVGLARRQERELRAWLYGPKPRGGATASLAAAVRGIADDVEAAHAVEVEPVVVGDIDVDDDVRALLAAVREAATNAAVHAGASKIDLFAEVEQDRVSAFVRDRGRGFDVATVPGDRRGIRDSVIGRVERHGGRASIRSTPGDGTEVELSMPRRHRPREESP